MSDQFVRIVSIKIGYITMDNNDDQGGVKKIKKVILDEQAALKNFQSSVALALLDFTGNLESEHVERRLASALLFLAHLSSEITRGFANGDEQIASGLLTDAIIECRRAYPDTNTTCSTLFH